MPQPAALEAFKKEGVIFKTYNKRMMKAFRKAWDKSNKLTMQKNPEYEKWYKHFKKFQKNYNIWAKKAYIPME